MASSRKQFKTIDEYIAAYPEDVRPLLEKMRRVIREAASQADEAISYGIPTFKLHGNLVHFAAFKNHISFFPTPSAIVAFKKELAPYKQAKGTVQFPLDQSIPFGLVRKIVKFRVKQNLAKK